MASTDIEFSKQMALRGLAEAPAVAAAVAVASPKENTIQDTVVPITEAQEMANLKQVILGWRELESEVSILNAQIREKRKRQKALEEVILRIMNKHNIGALDLKGSGGRLLLRRQTTKTTLNPKVLEELLTEHLKSKDAATNAMEFIVKNRGSKVRERLLYEKGE